jgi:hypothetical protein
VKSRFFANWQIEALSSFRLADRSGSVRGSLHDSSALGELAIPERYGKQNHGRPWPSYRRLHPCKMFQQKESSYVKKTLDENTAGLLRPWANKRKD